ncbi:MAG: DUF87 domain-containing protein [Ktedonobacteraceae bacterium]|nr:DUF87 domain-containing protein [Ktedonobacteraceae bacterium]
MRWIDTPKIPYLEEPESYWNKKLAQARAASAPGLRMGTSVLDGSFVGIPEDDLSTHMHVVGATNVGKSYFLEGIMKQLLLSGNGLCLIDPHGDLYHRMLQFCAYADKRRPELNFASRVIPIDPAETQQIVGFNPVKRNARVMTYQVVALMEAIRKCWGQTTFTETPRLARWLFNVAYAVIDANVTFLQTYNMVNPQPDPYRRKITSRIQNPRIRAEWEYLYKLAPEKREERIESCLNRIKPFVEHEIIRAMLGQSKNTLDFASVLEQKNIVLINLSKQNVISEDNQKMLGSLLVNELLTAAFARPVGRRSPFYLFIDEFQHFVTKDICEILDGGRKFGLHLVLAHQHLSQLKVKDPEVYYSTLTNARTKAVFGDLIDEDLDVLSKELFTGELNTDEIKDEIWQTKYHPVESSRTVRSQSAGRSDSESYGTVSHSSISSGKTFIPGSSPWLPNEEQSFSTSESASSGESQTGSCSFSENESESDVPFYEYHAYSELSSRTFRSLEEQLYAKKAQLRKQPRQHFSLLVPGSNVKVLKAPTVNELSVSEDELTSFKQQCFDNAGCFQSPEHARKEIERIEIELVPEGELSQSSRASAGGETEKRRSPLADLLGKE